MRGEGQLQKGRRHAGKKQRSSTSSAAGGRAERTGRGRSCGRRVRSLYRAEGRDGLEEASRSSGAGKGALTSLVHFAFSSPPHPFFFSLPPTSSCTAQTTH